MPTFRKGHSARSTLKRQITVGTIATTSPLKVNWYVDPSDAVTLRGIPAIGRGVQGAIHGTRPDIHIDNQPNP
jgi:hypothetical protein